MKVYSLFALAWFVRPIFRWVIESKFVREESFKYFNYPFQIFKGFVHERNTGLNIEYTNFQEKRWRASASLLVSLMESAEMRT